MLSTLLDRHRVLVCLGSGGSGKTTLAAAIGLYAARAGHETVVITIDPARRLASALGLSALSEHDEQIDVGALHADIPGRFSAMMLAQKPAWDRLVRRHAATEERAARILANRFYARLSNDLAGAHAYAAIDTVLELLERPQRRIILDTPPTRFALDFFQAPTRWRAMLDGGTLQRLLDAYGGLTGDGWMKWASTQLLRAAGPRMLNEVAELFELGAPMIEPLVARAKAMEQLLSDGRTGFVVVSTPDPRAIEESTRLIDAMPALGLRPSALVFNRTSVASPGGGGAAEEGGAPLLEALSRLGLGPEDASWVSERLACHRQRARGEDLRTAELLGRCDPAILQARLPELDHDVHDLDSLYRLGLRLGDASTLSGGG